MGSEVKTKLIEIANELAMHKVPVEDLQECIEGVMVEYVRGTKTIKLPRYILHRLYIKYELRQSTIAKILGCSQDTVSRYLRLYNIPRRQSKLEMSKRTIIHLYLGEKKSAAEIADVYHCSKMTILRRLHTWGILNTVDTSLKTQGVLVGKTNRNCTAEDVGALIELDYINGMSYGKLSEKYGITRYRLKKYLIAAGLELRRSAERIKLDEKQIVQLYQAGATVKDIARRLGVGCTTVADRLKEQGVILRGNKKVVDVAAVVRRYNHHIPMLRIAEETGYSYEAVRRCVREHCTHLSLLKTDGHTDGHTIEEKNKK